MIYLFLILVASIFFGGGIIRNKQVYKLRIEILDTISDLAKEDINNGRDYTWRFDEFRKVSYDEMYRKFWIPLKPKNFYKDLSFLK